MLDLPVFDISMVLEGGSIEVDGRGTLMAKKSSILNSNRNDGWEQTDVEAYLSRYLGVSNFIWLKGRKSNKDDITDDHIDGTARFANEDTIVTFYPKDFIDPKEYNILKSATDANNKPYKIVHLPLTKKKIKSLGNDYGVYINYYIGNDVVLVPTYNDPNDTVALNILKNLYNYDVTKNNNSIRKNHYNQRRRVISIECTELAKDGGMIHCVTQQQPA